MLRNDHPQSHNGCAEHPWYPPEMWAHPCWMPTTSAWHLPITRRRQHGGWWKKKEKSTCLFVPCGNFRDWSHVAMSCDNMTITGIHLRKILNPAWDRISTYNHYAFICFNGPDLLLKGAAPTSLASNHHHHIVSSFQERVVSPSIVSESVRITLLHSYVSIVLIPF